MTLTLAGDLAPGARICDIGATQLIGNAAKEGARSFLSFYAERSSNAVQPEQVPEQKLNEISTGGFLGDLLLLAGFQYQALDIFHGTNTILFDLNVHAPGPKLIGNFDLVMNFGTTEHVFNQLRAFQTIHDLMKVGAIVYHDLPLSGYFDHALFRYDPMFFRVISEANSYESLLQEISIGAEQPVPGDLRRQGYTPATYLDGGIEVVLRRTSEAPFRIPLETSTSLGMDAEFQRVAKDDFVNIPQGVSVSYGSVSSARCLKVWSIIWGAARRLQHGAAAFRTRS